MTNFSSILVANRGEIACRIMRTAKTLGYRTIAVYSDADHDAPHVRLADEAHRLGPAPAADSYLNIERLLEAARKSGAGAVHPGYGFLSENTEFARACEDAGLTFIGPSSDTIERMGNKAGAKRLMIAPGVPCVPGYEGDDQSDDAFVREAARIGFPLMVKAAAGGGGRGMRLVEDGSDLINALFLARSEALNAFDSGELILEKAIIDARHIEIQIFADAHGTFLHFGERDCSVQRRHQKVVEEAPAPGVSDDLRERMGKAAIDAARSVEYVGAGTVEFLLDDTGAFYFLEMNTRIQVEHPVTEAVTGHDLVALQIAVANGEPLGLEQDDIELVGHAIEARLYAEDPANGFLPASGRIVCWRPADTDDIRTDTGIETGSIVSTHYDPMLAKIVGWGANRNEARRKLARALIETTLFGPHDNRAFLSAILQNPVFAAGAVTTGFIGEEFPDGLSPVQPASRYAALAAILHYEADRAEAHAGSIAVSPILLDWSSSGIVRTNYRLVARDRRFAVSLVAIGKDSFDIHCDADRLTVAIHSRAGDSMQVEIEGHASTISALMVERDTVWFSIDGETHCYRKVLNSNAEQAPVSNGSRILAPMHGTLTDIFVTPGTTVAKGTRLAILEAMKMQHEVIAPLPGLIDKVQYGSGSQVAAGDLLFEIALQQPPTV